VKIPDAFGIETLGLVKCLHHVSKIIKRFNFRTLRVMTKTQGPQYPFAMATVANGIKAIEFYTLFGAIENLPS